SNDSCLITARTANQLITIDQWRFTIAIRASITTPARKIIFIKFFPDELSIGDIQADEVACRIHGINPAVVDRWRAFRSGVPFPLRIGDLLGPEFPAILCAESNHSRSAVAVTHRADDAAIDDCSCVAITNPVSLPNKWQILVPFVE